MPPNEITRELRLAFQDEDYARAYAEDFLNARVATQIKVLREDRGLTQAQVAELAGMKQSRISLMEDVNYGSWSVKTLRRLAAAFDVILKVSFESYEELVADAALFSRSELARPSRVEALSAAERAAPEDTAETSAMIARFLRYTPLTGPSEQTVRIDHDERQESSALLNTAQPSHFGILGQWGQTTVPATYSALEAIP
jgi:transcriptional regulator with XRE-family HTH domain